MTEPNMIEPNPIRIVPSLLSADVLRLAEQVRALEEAGADELHVDVMDGHFVPNMNGGLALVEALAGFTRLPIDVHLMISEPDRFGERFARAGASSLTYHFETPWHKPSNARRAGSTIGVALKPNTPVDALRDQLSDIDRIVIMSVEPGFSGQAFMPEVLSKVERLRAWSYPGDIEVDGGIDADTIALAAAAGANVFVSGSGILETNCWTTTIRDFRELALAAQDPSRKKS